ncbi:MAG: bifunctional UDP-N-acetylglucosamine diphosphorylase/glucosamine-1-phosphate N-acetyltransferase GlmU [Deltaproteobacteria bacterium]|nr:bifunctional UDP-N-acetylglucosamine diphosphorylase/glucosamine-1-phosphate N-acetyltransferase GlmU [Deltaproteobacteria bacterium]
MNKFATIILAAGKGTRMNSQRAKVLHTLLGKPLIEYPISLAQKVKSEKIVLVTGHQNIEVEKAAENTGIENISFALQKEQLGTGHAVLSALPGLKGFKGPILILSGDVPLLTVKTVNALKKAYKKSEAKAAFITFNALNPHGYGRVITNGSNAVAIREQKDCSEAEKKITTVNAGIYLMDSLFLNKAVAALKSENAQKELYLTDVIEMAAKLGKVPTVNAHETEVTGVNSLLDLTLLQKKYLQIRMEKLMEKGVTIPFPETVYIEDDCTVGSDSFIAQGVHIYGKTKIGKNVIIEQGVLITDCIIRDDSIIRAYSVLEQADVGNLAEVGPMGRLRPGSVLKKGAKVGNWVELKKTTMGEGSKANHLAYLGDGEIGKNVNLGAGSIFCNYDGFLKHKTIIDDNVFVGSDSQIVAPVHIEEGAYVASGTTVVANVPKGALAISRTRQQNKKGYGILLKQRLKARKEAMLKAASDKK